MNAPPVPPAPAVAADPVVVGTPIAKEIASDQTHRYRLQLRAGEVVRGVVQQQGTDVVVVIYDTKGAKLAEHDSPNGDTGPEPFVIEGSVAGGYDLEIKPFVEQGTPGKPLVGKYELRVDELLDGEAYAEAKAKEVVESAKVREALKLVRAKQPLDAWWASLAKQTPVIEPYPGDPKSVLITFVMRSSGPYVGMFGGPDFREKPMVRVPDSDVWYLSARMPVDSVFDYSFIVADGPAAFSTPWRPNGAGGDRRFAKKQPDPNNPVVRFGDSRVSLPGAVPQPYVAERAAVAKGKLAPIVIESAALKEKRKVGVYTPPGHDPTTPYPLLVVFDGEAYGTSPQAMIQLPVILDNLIADHKIPPLVAAFVDNQGTRNRDLPGSKDHALFVTTELIPRMRTEWKAGLTPETTIATGSSFGGLASLFIGFHHNDVVGNVVSNSAALQYNGMIDGDIPPWAEANALIDLYGKSPKLPLDIYLDAGRFEADLRDQNRHLRDVLLAKGYPVTYAEYSGGHDYWMWRGTIADGLIAVLAK